MGAPKIADFGLAKILDSDQARTRSGAILGTPVYMAPEQARGDGRAVTPLADVYALGVILFECLTGRAPFDGDATFDVLLKVISTDALPPSRFRPRLSRDLDTICLKCLEKDPARRYASAAELAEDLDRFAAGDAITARPDGPMRKVGRKLRRRPLAVALALLLVGTVALGGGFWQLRRLQGESALAQGRERARHGDYADAAECFDTELRRCWLPGCSSLRDELYRGWIAAVLRDLAERLTFKFDPEHLNADDQRRLAESCRKLWDERDLILAHTGDADPAWEAQVRSDLRDVALRGLEFRGRDDALTTIDQLEAFGAPSQVIELERANLQGAALPAIDLSAPQSATEFYLLGRALRRANCASEAETCFRAGLRLNPQALKLHVELAALEYRAGRFESALTSYIACLAIQPASILYSRRGLTQLALGRTSAALADFDDALRLDAANGEARFGRGQVRRILRQMAGARSDFELAIEHGYSRERVLYPLAVTLLDADAPDEARRCLRLLLTLRPGDRDARAMMDELDRRSGKRNP
jgi:tetratricopeptide (TPR) repeat protein